MHALKYLRFYEARGLTVERARGQYVWGADGRKYLDMHTCHGVAFLGHAHPHVIEVLKEQLETVSVLSTSFHTRVMDDMLDALSRVAGNEFEWVTLLNSGSEAVELAIKLARRATGRKVLVAFTGSFHGRTLGALSLTHNPRYRRAFEPLLPEVRFGRFNDVEGVEDVIKEDVAAVVLEVIQGEGGVNVADEAFVKAVAERAREVGALLVVDEVQTGFGRTGRVWAHTRYGIKPDIITAGKALGGGFPVSAVLTTDYVASRVKPGDHGTTYGGNPLACAAVKAASEVLLTESVPEQARVKGEALMRALRSRLAGNPLVRDVRGAGLMIGVNLRKLPGPVLRCAQGKGVLLLKAGATVVRALPPYLISEDDEVWFVDTLTECLEGLAEGVADGVA